MRVSFWAARISICMIGIIVDGASNFSEAEISKIQDEFTLKAVFIALCDEDEIRAKFLSRKCSAPYILLEDFKRFTKFACNVKYFICNSAAGVLYSLLNYRPCYFSIKQIENLNSISRLFPLLKKKLIIPYNSNDLSKIRKVEVQDLDFSGILNSIIQY